MARKVKAIRGHVRGFTLKGNKRQLSLIQSNMKTAFGSDITVGKLSSLMNTFPRVRWQFLAVPQ